MTPPPTMTTRARVGSSAWAHRAASQAGSPGASAPMVVSSPWPVSTAVWSLACCKHQQSVADRVHDRGVVEKLRPVAPPAVEERVPEKTTRRPSS